MSEGMLCESQQDWKNAGRGGKRSRLVRNPRNVPLMTLIADFLKCANFAGRIGQAKKRRGCLREFGWFPARSMRPVNFSKTKNGSPRLAAGDLTHG